MQLTTIQERVYRANVYGKSIISIMKGFSVLSVAE